MREQITNLKKNAFALYWTTFMASVKVAHKMHVVLTTHKKRMAMI